jgi:8-oxo-dGTP pyrophosphatase MutT (NUDIX family)
MRRAFSVAVYPRHQGRLLLIHHRRLGVWLPPGGECAPGETPLEAARRELLEETGLEARFPQLSAVEGTPPGLIGYEEHQAGAKGTHLNFVFVADVASAEVRPNDEFSEWRWLAPPWPTSELAAPPNVWQLADAALGLLSSGASPVSAGAGLAARAALAGGELVTLARRWLAAFNARDLAALLALYAEGAVHLSPKLRAQKPESGGRIAGKAELAAWWGDAFARLPSMRYREIALTADDQRVWMEYERTVDGQPPLTVAEVLEVEAGAIVASRVYHG